MYNSGLPSKPAALDNETEDRWRQNSLRYRMLTGLWISDLEEELQRHFTAERRAVLGIADMSSNVFSGVTKALTSLYVEPPSVSSIAPAEQLFPENYSFLSHLFLLHDH